MQIIVFLILARFSKGYGHAISVVRWLVNPNKNRSHLPHKFWSSCEDFVFLSKWRFSCSFNGYTDPPPPLCHIPLFPQNNTIVFVKETLVLWTFIHYTWEKLHNLIKILWLPMSSNQLTIGKGDKSSSLLPQASSYAKGTTFTFYLNIVQVFHS